MLPPAQSGPTSTSRATAVVFHLFVRGSRRDLRCGTGAETQQRGILLQRKDGYIVIMECLLNQFRHAAGELIRFKTLAICALTRVRDSTG